MARSLEDRVKSLDFVARHFRAVLAAKIAGIKHRQLMSELVNLGYIQYLHDEVDRVIKDEPRIVNGIKRYG